MDVEKENDDPGRKRHVKREDNEVEAKRSRKNANRGSSNSVTAIAGRIKTVELENFMCHRHLKVPFDVQKNNCFYIGGPNGSGKSALFHALNLGLGGSSRKNERGSCVSDYIKEGEASAKIIITLTNTGDKCFRPEDFGDAITIERTISKTSSTYAMKASPDCGRERKDLVVSRKKGDLDLMLHYMDIQLENPIFWMSQDRSRHFLSQMVPGKLFEIFATATELDRIEDNYKVIHEYIHDIKTSEKSAKERNLKEREKIELMKKKREALGQLNRQRSELLCLEWMQHQCPVRDALKKSEGLGNKLAEVKKARLVLKQRKQDMCTQKADMDGDIAAVKVKIEGFRRKLESLEEVRKELDEQFYQCRGKIDVSKSTLERLNQEMRLWKEQFDKAAGNLKRIQDSQGSNDVFTEIQSLRKETSDLTSRAMTISKRLEDAKSAVPTLNSRRMDLSRQHSEADAKLDQLKHEITSADKRLAHARRVNENNLNKFGGDTANILRLIQQHKSEFEQEPFGPIGRFVTVKNDKWAFAVEECVKRTLYQYVFHSKKDETLFYQLLRRNKINPPSTIISRFGLPSHDTTASEPSSQFHTVLRELSFAHPMSRNVLIDMCGIESILLLEGEEASRTLMRQNCPENGYQAYTLEGTHIYGATRNGQYRAYANTTDRAAKLLGNDSSFNIRNIEIEIDRRKAEIPAEREILNKAQKDHTECNNQFRNLEEFISKSERELNEINRRKRTIEAKIIALEEKNDNNDLDTLQAACDELAQKIAQNKGLIAEEQKNLREVTDNGDAIKADLTEVQQEKRGIADECKPEEDTFEGLVNKIGMVNSELEGIDIELENFKNEDNNVRDMISIAHKELDEAQQQAAATSNVLPVPPGFTNPPDYTRLPEKRFVDEEIGRIRREIQDKECAAGGDAIPTAEEISKRRQDFSATRKALKDFSDLAKVLEDAVKYRELSLPLIRRAIARRLHDKFKEIMQLRDFGSKIDINFEGRTIDITVDTQKKGGDSDTEAPSPQKQSKAKTDKVDLKGLSGGERSYTTAAFVVALWEVMDAPFRCMDEFDVFLDMINRKIVMDLLVKEATTSYSHSQFLFFTPQGIKELSKNERVQIYEMNKPRD